MNNSGTLVLSNINEEDRKIVFNPPLVIDYYITTPEVANIIFDFGLDCDICFVNMITYEYKTIEEKLRKYIEFELFHSFFHLQEDPNYSTFNWSLFGNLFYRVKCFEDYGDDKDSWGYKIENGKLKMIENYEY